MNLKSPDKNYNEDDEINLEEKEKNIEKFNDYIGKNYIGKKRNKILDDDYRPSRRPGGRKRLPR